MIEVDLPPGLDCNFITNFSSTSHASHLYFFGGYTWPLYDQSRHNLYELCPPHVSHNVKPEKGSVLFSLDLADMELSYVTSQDGYETADGTLQILSKDEQDAPNNILIVGGISGRVDLYSTYEFELDHCCLDQEYGGCSVEISTKNKELLTCIVPKCRKQVHRHCDTFTRGIGKVSLERYFCPTCANIDPKTRKKRQKAAGNK